MKNILITEEDNKRRIVIYNEKRKRISKKDGCIRVHSDIYDELLYLNEKTNISITTLASEFIRYALNDVEIIEK